MNVEKMKELETLRLNKEKLSQQHYQIIVKKRNELISASVTQFDKYFSDKGFKVVKSNSMVLATYNTLGIRLTLPDPKDSFLGAITILELSISTPRKDYDIPVVTCGEVGGIRIETGEIKRLGEDTAEADIASCKKEIVRLEQSISEAGNISYCFGYVDKAEAKKNSRAKLDFVQYSTFLEILEELFDS